MKREPNNLIALLVVVFLSLMFYVSAPAQKVTIRTGALPVTVEDTSRFPFDFNDQYYWDNGVNHKFILNRRDGNDLLSVFTLANSPIHRNVRVLATLPAYDQYGNIQFWTPLGALNYENGFAETVPGEYARQIAGNHILYVFPRTDTSQFGFYNTRQAALITDTPYDYLYEKGNPLGLRTVVFVAYTEKAFNTKMGIFMMESMEKKNGRAADGTPLLKSVGDIEELMKDGYVALQKASLYEEPSEILIAPVIRNLQKGAIAPDSFLITTTLPNGLPLPGEQQFAQQFGCLQKNGDWCRE